jgi:hypothetical protein
MIEIEVRGPSKWVDATGLSPDDVVVSESIALSSDIVVTLRTTG